MMRIKLTGKPQCMTDDLQSEIMTLVGLRVVELVALIRFLFGVCVIINQH